MAENGTAFNSIMPPKDLPVRRSDSLEFSSLSAQGEAIQTSITELLDKENKTCNGADKEDNASHRLQDTCFEAPDEDDKESIFNRIRETCSSAASTVSNSPGVKIPFSSGIPLLEKMRRVDFFQSGLPKKQKVRTKKCSANERLYNSALTTKERKEKLTQESELEAERKQAASKFKLPEGSRKLMERYHGEIVGEVGSRLHAQGLIEKERKIKLSDEAKQEMEAGKTN